MTLSKDSLTQKLNPPKQMKKANQRSMARFAATQALYQMDIAGTPLNQVLNEFEQHRLESEYNGWEYLKADKGYLRALMHKVVALQKEVDPEIDVLLKEGWPLGRIDVFLRAILRCAATELKAFAHVPSAVAINEYVDIAKAYYDKEEARAVNGVLDTYCRRHRSEEPEKTNQKKKKQIEM